MTLTIICNFSQVVESLSFINGYSIDSTGSFGRDCEIISGTVTAINCPREDKLDIYLTEMMANTTLSDITNEIKGSDDTVVTTDSEKDYIRHISMSAVQVAAVKMSNEVSDPLYKNSMIVMIKNETAGATANQYSVIRYWQNIYTNWIEKQHLFDIKDGPYDDIFVFDKYAVVMKNKNVISAVYYNDFRGNIVPVNYVIALYDDLKIGSNVFQKITFWDYTGQGDYKMIAAITSSGSVSIYAFDDAINYEQ